MLSGVTGGFTPWSLVQRVSPRSHVRVQVRLPDGSVDPANEYRRAWNIAGPDPGVPWAMPLADDEGRYHFLVFDFDAHSGDGDAATRDMAALVSLLERVGNLPYVVCESSPGRGFHVWLALSDPLPARDVRSISDPASRWLPSLDTTPLNSAGTGLARTPGSPHRFGGASTILYGDATCLLAPTITHADVIRLADELERVAPAPPPPTYRKADVPTVVTLVDIQGHRHLPGAKLPLGPVAHRALTEPLGDDQDASAVLFTVLLGAARARWRFQDLLAHLATAPGLEHARSSQGASRRIPRGRSQQLALLERQWERALTTAAATRPLPGTGAEELAERCELVALTVAAARAHADASPGRWAPPAAAGRRASQQCAVDRAVLDEIHRIALHCLQLDVGVSLRTLAQRVPAGKEAVRQALQRLAAEGWVRLAQPAAGTSSAVWSIDPNGVFHSRALQMRTLGGPTPQRRPLLSRLDELRKLGYHDVFTARALGCAAGRLYAHLRTQPGLHPAQLALTAGVELTSCHMLLERLSQAGLAWSLDGRWRAHPRSMLDTAAEELGVVGVLDERAMRYKIEQATWAYLQAELQGAANPILRPSRSTRLVRLVDGSSVHLAPYPRGVDGRLDWRTARELIATAHAA